MISFTDALEIVESRIKAYEQENELALQILLDKTLEEDFGWVFFYNSKEFIRSGDASFLIAGNAPLIVDRKDGSLHVTGTSNPTEFYIQEYKRKRSLY